MKKLVTALFFFIISSYFAFSDSVPYRKTVSITTESENFIIKHYHDWSINYAYIECISKKTNDIIFRIPSPALTRLFISNDEQFIAGLSNIQIDNPYQFVVLNIAGEYIIRNHVREILRNYYQTVTNYIYWFNENDPEIEFIYKNNELIGISLLNFDRNDLIIGKSNLEYNKKRIIIYINKLKKSYFLIIGIVVVLVVCISLYIKKIIKK